MDNPASNLAANVLELRKKKSMSQQDLAKLSGLPRTTLTHFESGSSNPSLQNLIRIARALRVSIEELLARPTPRSVVIRRADVPVVVRSGGKALFRKLLPDPIPGMEIDQIELKQGARLGGTPHLPGTKEYLTCQSGRLGVRLEGKLHVLDVGDMIAFFGNQRHAYENQGSGRAIGFSVVVLAR